MKFEDLTGQKFNKLTVIKYIGKLKSGQSKWLCQCDCPEQNFHEAIGSHLKTGNVKSCGCLTKGTARREASLIHGGVGTSEYESYHAAKKRCNPKFAKKYPRHAGRGIEFRYKNFQEFLADLGPKPEPKADYTCDRRDNDGHYEPGNCRWATKEQQAGNRRCDNCAGYKARIAELEAQLVTLTTV